MTEVKWDDLSDEKYRVYTFPCGAEYKIVRPQKLHVKMKPEGHSHRVIAKNFDGAVISHYIPAGWIGLRWEVKPGSEPFKFLEASQ